MFTSGKNRWRHFELTWSIVKWNKRIIIVLLTIGFWSCQNESKKTKISYLTEETPNDIPIAFKKEITPKNKIIHKGIFSPDLQNYYYTISDKNFEKFDVFTINKFNGRWSEPKKAFFNSAYDEHGMSFSPNGNTLYFSSTRPVNVDGVSPTWHIWKTEFRNGTWNTPVFVDIPNMRHKLVSHPTVAHSGTLFFHASELDYSGMDIYHSKMADGKYKEAKKTPITMNSEAGKCTPYISPDENYIVFATIGKQLDLMISFNDGNGAWINTKRLNDKINDSGQGNPYITPDQNYLFFTSGDHNLNNWKVKWVNIEGEIENARKGQR